MQLHIDICSNTYFLFFYLEKLGSKLSIGIKAFLVIVVSNEFVFMCLKLENMLGGDEIYKTHITKHLVPCIAQFAVAMGDDSQWKVLNYQILLKMRHSSPKVCRFLSMIN